MIKSPQTCVKMYSLIQRIRFSDFFLIIEKKWFSVTKYLKKSELLQPYSKEPEHLRTKICVQYAKTKLPMTAYFLLYPRWHLERVDKCGFCLIYLFFLPIKSCLKKLSFSFSFFNYNYVRIFIYRFVFA